MPRHPRIPNETDHQRHDTRARQQDRGAAPCGAPRSARRPVVGYEGAYEASDRLRVRSVATTGEGHWLEDHGVEYDFHNRIEI